jgi:hypothetical protein
MTKRKIYWTFTTEHSEPEIGTWKIKGKWHMVRKTPEVFEVTISSASAESPITTTALRAIPLSRIFDEQRATLKSQQVDRIMVAVESIQPRTRSTSASGRTAQGSRQGVALDDELLKRTAAEYHIAQISGLPVQQHIAAFFNVSRSTAAKRIMAARAKGFIKDPTRPRDPEVLVTPMKKISPATVSKVKSTRRKT